MSEKSIITEIGETAFRLNANAQPFNPKKRKHDELLSILNNKCDDGVLERFKKQNRWLLEHDPLLDYEKSLNPTHKRKSTM